MFFGKNGCSILFFLSYHTYQVRLFCLIIVRQMLFFISIQFSYHTCLKFLLKNFTSNLVKKCFQFSPKNWILTITFAWVLYNFHKKPKWVLKRLIFCWFLAPLDMRHFLHNINEKLQFLFSFIYKNKFKQTFHSNNINSM